MLYIGELSALPNHAPVTRSGVYAYVHVSPIAVLFSNGSLVPVFTAH